MRLHTGPMLLFETAVAMQMLLSCLEDHLRSADVVRLGDTKEGPKHAIGTRHCHCPSCYSTPPFAPSPSSPFPLLLPPAYGKHSGSAPGALLALGIAFCIVCTGFCTHRPATRGRGREGRERSREPNDCSDGVYAVLGSITTQQATPSQFWGEA